MTNCNVPYSVAQFLTVIVPISLRDVPKQVNFRWQTRVLYNAYLPFHYNFILDTHVFPCHNDSYSKLFSLFMKSGVDVSASNREGDRLFVSGGGVLSKWGPKSHAFWKKAYKLMDSRAIDDQSAIYSVVKFTKRPVWKYRWLSSNWFWASHGINEKGLFVGSAKCYRSSVIATGPIKWIHGAPTHCIIMNGKNDEYVHRKRVFFLRRLCNTSASGPNAVFSKKRLEMMAAPFRATHLDWSVKHSSSSLFWYL